MSNKTPKKSVGELAVAATIPFSIKAKARFDMREKLDFRFTWHTYSGSPELTGIITGLHAYAHDMGIRLNDELLMRTLHTTFDGLRKDVRKKNPEVAVGKNATLAQKMEKKNALLELDQDNNEKKKVEGVQQTKESLVVNEDEGDTDDEEDKEPGSDKDPDGEDGDEEELEKEKKQKKAVARKKKGDTRTHNKRLREAEDSSTKSNSLSLVESPRKKAATKQSTPASFKGTTSQPATSSSNADTTRTTPTTATKPTAPSPASSKISVRSPKPKPEASKQSLSPLPAKRPARSAAPPAVFTPSDKGGKSKHSKK